MRVSGMRCEQRFQAPGLTSGRLKVAVVSTAKCCTARLLGSTQLHPRIISLEVLQP